MPDQIVQLQTNSAAGSGGATGRLPLTRFKVKELTGGGVVRCHTLSENGEGEIDYYVASYNAQLDSEIFAARVEGNTGSYQDDFPLEWLGFFDGFTVVECDGSASFQVQTLAFGTGFTIPDSDPDFPNTAVVSLNINPGLGIHVDYLSCEAGVRITSLGIQVSSPGGESPAPICGVFGIDFSNLEDRPPPTEESDPSGLDWTNDANWHHWPLEFTLTSTVLESTCFDGKDITQAIVTAKIALPKGLTDFQFREEMFYDATPPGAFKKHRWKEYYVAGIWVKEEAMEDETIVTLGPCTTP